MIGSARSSVSTPRRKRVIFVPRTPHYSRTPRFAISAVERSLKTPPKERSLMNIEAIHSVLKTWPNFVAFNQSEEIQKSICASLIREEFPDGCLLFKPGDISDGWSFVYKGSCFMIEECEEEPENDEEKVPLNYQKVLFSTSYRKTHYRIIKKYVPHEDFGRDELKKSSFKKNYCVSCGETVLLKIDPYQLKFVSEQYKSTMVTRKANALMQSGKFDILMDQNDVLNRLAASLEECTIDKGFVISDENPVDKGIIIVESGTINVKRIIDFSNINLKKEDFMIGNSPVKKPTGVQSILSKKVGVFGTLALPEMYQNVYYPFTAEAVEDCTCFLLHYDDLFALVPMYMQKIIISNILDLRTDEQVVKDWLANQGTIRWKIYKKRCEYEAMDYNKACRNGEKDDIIARVPHIPISFGEYNPRRTKVRLSTTM